MPERLVLCSGAKRAGGNTTLRLALSGRSQNFRLQLEDISKKMVRNVPDLLIDLIEIATYVYCADQATSRGGAAQVGMGADWRRSFRFVVPVRNPDHWNHRSVLEPLCSTLSFLSEDDYAFEFEKTTNPAPFQDYLEFGDYGGGAAFKADEVVLFSGGLDSLSGAIDELSTDGKRVALVSHRSSPKIFDHQKHLITELNTRFPQKLMHVPVLVTRLEPLRVQEYTQRSRSFLYAALACVVARLFGLSRIRFFENGVVSINLPISEQVVGARATRSTHPLVFDHFPKFFSAAVGKPIEIDNPFIWKTKEDVIRSIVDHDCGGLIKHTVSCTRVYDITRLHTHCGCCSQCLDRRFAILAANAADHDPVEMYMVELLAGPRDEADDQTMAESYVRTALELRELGDLAFFGRFGGETARVLKCFPSLSADEVGRRVFDLHQRHAQAIGDVLQAAVEGHSAQLVDRILPLSSLLMMTVSPGAALALATIGKRTDSLQAWIDEIEAEPASAGRGAPEPQQRRPGKSRPALDRAQCVIKELYPDGVPDQASEPNALRRVVRRCLTGLVTIGKHNDIASLHRQFERAQPGCRECGPCRLSGRLHGRERVFDALGDQQPIRDRTKPHRAPTTRAKHHLRRFDRRLASAVAGQKGAVDRQRRAVAAARHQRDHRRPELAARMLGPTVETERGRNRHDDAA